MYHSDYSAVSCSMLKLFRRSRVEYNLTYNARTLPPWKPTAPALLGTVLHAMLLEDVPLEDQVITYPADCLNKNGDLIGHNAKIFRAMHDDKIAMKEREIDGIRAAVEAVLAHPEIRNMLAASTHREHRFDAELLGVPCKCKPDIVGDLTRYVACYDLKFSLNIDPDSWRRTSKRLAYWLQTCHYSRVLEANFKKPVQFRFCNIEVKPPYRMMWYWYDLRSLEIASDEHRRLLLDLKECQESGVWEDGWESECVLSPWDIAAEVSSDEVEISE